MSELNSLSTVENAQNRRAFWGTIALSGIFILLSAYFLAVLFQQPPTVVVYIATALFLSLIAASVVSIVLTVRNRQVLGSQIMFIAANLIGLMGVGFFAGRTLPSSLSVLSISFITIQWLMPGRPRRRYTVIAAAVFALTWAIEWISPPWRIQLSAATLGSSAAIVFGLIIFILELRRIWKGNIRVKVVTSFTVIALISVAIVGTVVYITYRNQVREDIRQRLLSMISIVALQQDGDAFLTITSANDAEYERVRVQNLAIRYSSPDIIYVYTMRYDDQGLYFVVDAGEPGEENIVAFGERYEEPSSTLAANYRTFTKPIVDDDIYTDDYGSFLSAYSPIWTDEGKVAGIIGLDIAADNVLEQERAVLFLILGTTLGTMVLVTLLGLFLGNLFVGPVINLSAVAKKIADGDLNARAKIETTDEIGELAKDFNIMTSQLQGTLQGLEQRVADRTRNLELAAEVGRAVSQVRALDVMLKDACELILKEFNLYYVQVYLTDPSGSTLKLEAGTGTVGAQLLGRGHSLRLDINSINGRAAMEKRPVVISDTSKSATFRQNPLLPDTQGEMAVPLIVADKVVGVLDIQASQPGVMTEEILPAFEALAGQLAVAIQNANLLEETNQARAQVEAQTRRLIREGWSEHLDAIHKPEQLGYVFAQNVVTSLAEVDEAQLPKDGNTISAPIAVIGEALGSLVVELDDETRTEQTSELVNIVARQVAQQIENLRLLESAERYRFEAEHAARLQTIEGWQAYVASRTGESLGYLYDTREVRPQVIGQDEDVSMFALPLKARDEMIGKLSVQGVTYEDQESVELVNAVAERLSAHIENLRLFEETRQNQFELDKRARQLASVAEISTISSQELDTSKLLETVATLTKERFNLYHAQVYLLKETDNTLKLAAGAGDVGRQMMAEDWQISVDHQNSIVARAARTRQSVIVNDIVHDKESEFLSNRLLPDTRSEMAVPLMVGDKILGVFDVQSARVNAFTQEDASIQTTLASQVATALQNARSFARAQQQADRESTLNIISQKIQSATTVEAVLQIAARELGHALGAPMTVAQLSMKDKS